jgi:hypothetical protein
MKILVIYSLMNLVSNVTDMGYIFFGSKFNEDISKSFTCKSC